MRDRLRRLGLGVGMVVVLAWAGSGCTGDHGPKLSLRQDQQGETELQMTGAPPGVATSAPAPSAPASSAPSAPSAPRNQSGAATATAVPASTVVSRSRTAATPGSVTSATSPPVTATAQPVATTGPVATTTSAAPATTTSAIEYVPEPTKGDGLCTRANYERTLMEFIDAFNAGDIERADRESIAHSGFNHFWTPERSYSDGMDRSLVRPYLQDVYGRGIRIDRASAKVTSWSTNPRTDLSSGTLEYGNGQRISASVICKTAAMYATEWYFQ